ncbi:MAG: hypothetical protein FWG87_09520 [Defluviitaleaceae bacterium]|nr:hypothetical protein [Defluviitaleaceae bacterium]
MKGIILKDDARYEYTEAYLRGKGYVFHAIDIYPRGLEFAIFPFKERVDTSAYNDDYFEAFGEHSHVFSGIRSEYLAEKCKKHGVNYHVMMEDRGTTVKNAVPTSEGVIAYLIHNLGRTIASSRILVVGYGVCGRDLARRLAALGADVSALVRSREKACIAQADSVSPVYLSDSVLKGFDAVINTAPAQIISNEMLKQADDTLMVDIASAPFGFDIKFAKEQNSRSAVLAAIPGKYAVQTAGEILGEYIDFILKA